MAYVNDPMGLVGYLKGSGGGTTSTAAKDLNYQQDLLSYLMSPNTGIGTGTYDPMIAVPPEYIPPATTILDSFEASSTPALKAVALKIRAKIIDPANAVAEVATALGITDTVSQNGMDMKSLRDAIASMFSEVTDVTNAENKHVASIKDWETTNQYGKGGFSQPYEQYTVDTLPYSSVIGDQQNKLDWLQREVQMNREKVGPKYEADRKFLYDKMMSDYMKSHTTAAEQAKLDASSPKADMYGVQTGDPNADPNQQIYTDAGPFYNSVPTDATTDSSGAVISKIETGPSQKSKNARQVQDQEARAGIALSLKAAEQARNKNPLDFKKEESDKLKRSLMINKMAELAAAKYMGRTPFSDQMAGRAQTI